MKNSNFIIILLALGLVFVTYKWIASANSPAEDSAATSNVAYDNIMTRSSIRAYTDQKVTSEQVDSLLRAAMAAPTARRLEPWRLVVVDKRDILDTIAARNKNIKMAETAQLAIITCGDMKATFEGETGFWVEDVSAATENVLLAAHSMGLGAVWCGIYPIEERVKGFQELLQLPSDIVPLACVCIGYPETPGTPKDKWKPENVHYNKW